jgi:hypothetical protein
MRQTGVRQNNVGVLAQAAEILTLGFHPLPPRHESGPLQLINREVGVGRIIFDDEHPEVIGHNNPLASRRYCRRAAVNS